MNESEIRQDYRKFSCLLKRHENFKVEKQNTDRDNLIIVRGIYNDIRCHQDNYFQVTQTILDSIFLSPDIFNLILSFCKHFSIPRLLPNRLDIETEDKRMDVVNNVINNVFTEKLIYYENYGNDKYSSRCFIISIDCKTFDMIVSKYYCNHDNYCQSGWGGRDPYIDGCICNAYEKSKSEKWWINRFCRIK
jgi:hypothetical protein